MSYFGRDWERRKETYRYKVVEPFRDEYSILESHFLFYTIYYSHRMDRTRTQDLTW